MNLVIAFVAGVLTWAWIGRLAWRYAMRAERNSPGADARQRMVERMPHDEFEALKASIDREATRRRTVM